MALDFREFDFEVCANIDKGRNVTYPSYYTKLFLYARKVIEVMCILPMNPRRCLGLYLNVDFQLLLCTFEFFTISCPVSAISVLMKRLMWV